MLRRIASSAARMQRMIDDLLDLTRIRSGGGLPAVPKPTDLSVVCAHVLYPVVEVEPGFHVVHVVPQ